MNTFARRVLLGLAASGMATFAKSQAEGALQPFAEKLLPPPPAKKAQIGADGAGHPENMPPSELADRVQHVVTGDQLTDEQREKASEPLHWAMGVGFGTGYTLVAAGVPAVRAGYGTVAATGLFTAAHVIGLPAAKVQHPPATMPAAWWIWEAGSHLVYGAVLDLTLRALERGLKAAGA